MNARVEGGLVRGFVDDRGGVLLPVGRVAAAAAAIVKHDAIADLRVEPQHVGTDAAPLGRRGAEKLLLVGIDHGDQRKLGVFRRGSRALRSKWRTSDTDPRNAGSN